LGYVFTFDRDLDMPAASISLSRTSAATIIKEEGSSSFSPNLLGIKFNPRFADVVTMSDYSVDELV